MKYSTPPKWLNNAITIVLIGAGGTGSELLDELVSMHYLLVKLGHPGLQVTVYDPDNVSPFNVGRQRFYAFDVGHNKAETLINRINTFVGLEWSAYPIPFTPQTLGYQLPELVITAVDTAQLRAEMGQYFANKRGDTLWLDGGNGNSDGNVILGHLCGDGKDRLPNVFDLYPSLTRMKDTDEDSCSHEDAIRKQDFGVNKSVARQMSGLIWNLLRHGGIDHHGAFLDTRTGESVPLKIDPVVWAGFGYTGESQQAH